MKEKLSKLSVVFAFFAIIAVGNISPLTASAAADTCTWTGANSANWSDGDNWSGCDNGGVPENVDVLIFPASASNKATNNDLVGLSPDSITINGTGYSIGGNAFNLVGTSPITANESATISANVHYESGSHTTMRVANNKTLTLDGTSDFYLTGFYELNIGAPSYNGAVDFTGNITGNIAQQFIAQNGARVIVRGSTNTFTANTVGAETNSIFECRSATCFGDNANSIYMGGGGIRLYTSATYNHGFQTSSSTPNDSWMEAFTDVSITGDGTVSDLLGIRQSGLSSTLQFTGGITLNQPIETFGDDTTARVSFDGALSGAEGVSIFTGTTVMSGASTFTGNVAVKDGAIVIVSQPNGLGSVTGTTTVENGGSLQLNTASHFTVNEPIAIIGDGNANSAGAIRNDGADNITLAGNITLNGDSTIRNASIGTDLNINGTISGNHSLTYHAVDNAAIEVGGASPNTYTGTTFVTGSTVYLEKTLAVPGDATLDAENPSGNSVTVYTYATDAIADSGTVTLNNDSDQLRIGESGTTEVIGGLTGAAGLISFQYDDSDLVVDQDFNSTFGGKFYADGKSATFTKRGTGNLLLAGGMQWNEDDDVNFVVEEGTMTINGDLSTDNGTDILVKDAGILKGNGKVGRLSTNGGTIAPGTSPGKLSVSSLALDATNTIDVELNGPNAGTQYDQIESSGAVSLADATLTIKPSYTPSAGQVFTIITGSSVTGTFKNMSNGSTVIVDGISFKVNYNATSVTLTYAGGTYDPSANDSLVNTGTGMLLAAIASILMIAGATALTARRQRNTMA